MPARTPSEIALSLLAAPQGAVALVHLARAECTQLESAALELTPSLIIRHLDSQGCPSRGHLIEKLGHLLGFPSYYSHNWDAMRECLIDRDFTPKAPTLLMIHNCDRLFHDEPATAAAFARLLDDIAGGVDRSNAADIARDAATYVPFWIILNCDPRRSPPRSLPSRALDLR